jgi:hypothetical protein
MSVQAFTPVCIKAQGTTAKLECELKLSINGCFSSKNRCCRQTTLCDQFTFVERRLAYNRLMRYKGVIEAGDFFMKAFCVLSVACAFGSIFGFDAPSNAATLASIHGAVQVNSGSGFHAVAGTAEVAPGASVMAASGASAEILYSDGCRIPVKPGAVAVVAPVSPCAQGQADPDQVPGANDYTYYYVLGGVAAAAGLGVGIWALTQSHT